MAVPTASAEPSGGTVIGGSATIQSNGPVTTVTQSSDRGIIRWSGFDVGKDETVRFQQPSSSSITVNRITDSKPSAIDGRLSANGNIVLINPNGVVFGPSSRTDVGGLIATTSDLDNDQDFIAGGPVKLTRPGNPDAAVVNNGAITVHDAGLAGLVAPHVENNGTIHATLGKVALASGDMHYIDLAGDGLISVAVSDDVKAQSVTNTGTVEADGGSVVITAAQARQLVDAVVTNSGTVQANEANGKTGKIAILGDKVEIGSSARISTTGANGGGAINIGGAYQGGDSLPASKSVNIAAGVSIDASATDNGNGGSVVVWSDGDTHFAGQAKARGGDAGGNGGEIEISGKNTLDFDGTVDLRAPLGETGHLLLDPTDITISNAANQSVTGTTTVAPNADNATSILNVTTLQNTLATASVTVQTRASGAQPGDITVANAVSWGSNNTLTLAAAHNIIVNAPITGKNLTLAPGNDLTVGAALNGTGSLIIQPGADQSMGIGTGQTGALGLDNTELGLLSGGWSSITLGQSSSAGQINVGGFNWSNSLTLLSGNGIIHINGAQSVGAHDLKIYTNADPDIGASLAGTGILVIAPSSVTTSMGLAGAPGTVQIDSNELDRLADGWTTMTFGGLLSQSLLQVNAYSNWKDRVLLYSGTGGISINGAQALNNNTLDILAQNNVTIGANVTGLKDLVLIESDATKTLGIGSAAGDFQIDQAELNRFSLSGTLYTAYSNTGYASLNIANAAFGNYTVMARNQGNISLGGAITSAYSNPASNKTSMTFQTTPNGTTGGNLTIAAGTTINPGTGRYVVYSRSPLLDSYNGFVRMQKRYGKTAANYATVGEVGNIFLYGITPTLNLTAGDATRQYGDANPAFSYSGSSGLIDGDTLTDALSATGLTTTATATSNVGPYVITGNPTMSALGYQPGTVTNGTLNITQAPLTATAVNTSREYGDANPGFAVQYTGFKNGEDSSVIDTLAVATSAAASATGAGSIVPITVGGAADNNYSFSYAPGSLTITKATLIAMADNQSRLFGDPNPPLTISYSGFKNGEGLSVIDTLATASTAATQSSNAGHYTITAAGGLDNNYAFNYVDGVLSIGQAPVLIIANPVKFRVDPALGALQLPVFTASYFGLKLGQDPNILTTPPLFTTTATNYSIPGDYIITPYGAVAENYVFSYQDGHLAVRGKKHKVDSSTPDTMDQADISNTEKQSKPLPAQFLNASTRTPNSPIKVVRDIALFYGLPHGS